MDGVVDTTFVGPAGLRTPGRFNNSLGSSAEYSADDKIDGPLDGCSDG